MKKVIVTGASGFIGRQTIPHLQKYGFDIHATTSKKKTGYLNDDITWHSVDMLDYLQVKDFCQTVQADNLMHLAWYDGSKERMSSPKNMAWVEASLQLVREFIDNGGKKVVLAGSCAEYDWQYGYCNEEITPTAPESFYGQCKASLNNIIQSYCRQRGVNYSCGRIFFVYGPYEFEDRLVAYVINSLLQNKPAKVTHGNQIRDYLHVADVAEALVELLKGDITGPVNIASGQPVTLRTIVDMIGKKLNKSDLLSYSSREERDVSHPVVLADIARLRDELKWVPTYDLEDGITATIDWWENKHSLTLSK